jgi:hypothetical protein
MLTEPLAPTDARTLIHAIVATGTVIFSSHARDEMAADGIDRATVLFVLRGGVVEPAELERGSWRYRVRAAGVYVVVAFRAEDKLVVVTAWRVK